MKDGDVACAEVCSGNWHSQTSAHRCSGYIYLIHCISSACQLGQRAGQVGVPGGSAACRPGAPIGARLGAA